MTNNGKGKSLQTSLWLRPPQSQKQLAEQLKEGTKYSI
jgi:hypothetical protein